MTEIKPEVSDVKKEQTELPRSSTADVHAVDGANGKFEEVAKDIEKQSTPTETELAEALMTL